MVAENGGGSSAPTPTAELAYPTAEVYAATDNLLDHFEEEQVPVGLGIFALVVALGRVLGPDDLEGESEQLFVRGVLDYITAYFAEGPAH